MITPGTMYHDVKKHTNISPVYKTRENMIKHGKLKISNNTFMKHCKLEIVTILFRQTFDVDSTVIHCLTYLSIIQLISGYYVIIHDTFNNYTSNISIVLWLTVGFVKFIVLFLYFNNCIFPALLFNKLCSCVLIFLLFNANIIISLTIFF